MSDLADLSTRDELIGALRDRVEDLLSATNRAAEEAFQQAMEDARRYAEEERARCVQAAEERIARLTELSESLLADAESIVARTTVLARGLTAASDALRDEFGLEPEETTAVDTTAQKIGATTAEAIIRSNEPPVPVAYGAGEAGQGASQEESTDGERRPPKRSGPLFRRFRRHRVADRAQEQPDEALAAEDEIAGELAEEAPAEPDAEISEGDADEREGAPVFGRFRRHPRGEADGGQTEGDAQEIGVDPESGEVASVAGGGATDGRDTAVGARMLAAQLRIAGESESAISRRLGELGVEDARADR